MVKRILFALALTLLALVNVEGGYLEEGFPSCEDHRQCYSACETDACRCACPRPWEAGCPTVEIVEQLSCS